MFYLFWFCACFFTVYRQKFIAHLLLLGISNIFTGNVRISLEAFALEIANGGWKRETG